MGLSAMLLGGTVGWGAQLFSNSIKKVPKSRQPWMHVGMFILGAYVGQRYVDLEDRLVEEINVSRASRGMPPLIGTAAWIRYAEPAVEK
ncbi:hypothetical protein MPSEU_000570200 [Mayamaea pseudoterrestris]|nr:hypothetical protein MPSEU_000570200 [Mayamaea pseudoterrestris]